ncbi:MAG TPA: toll/interleukin-1 receptor domain-containing protein [Panacibacter sp.]|nr:toll/interleukin-1 receptor domain-containing protein [Panacibacter sp.]HNP42704.1 toll/interleukin-1 receptor domain-containing protein [Panacibacter sp.]
MNIAAAIEETLAAIDKLIEQKIAVGLLERLQKSVEQLKKEWVYKKLTQEDAALKLYQLQTDLLGTVRFGLSADIKASASQRKDIPNYLYSLLQNNPAFSSFNDESPREHHTQKAKPPQTAMPEMAGAEPPEPQPAAAAEAALPAKGKILYDIPDSMKLNKQQKCVVRIAKDELTAKDSDTFTDAVKMEDIVLSGVMKVELIDIAEPPHFTIKTISSAEQEVDAESYTEWLFWVTPLLSGVFDLILKVSVIKTIEGKERRKDLVFEKAINIAAAAEDAPVSTGITTEPADTSNDNLKNLADEKNVKVIEPPAVFISYAHKDKVYFDIFSDNLRSQSAWNLWTDRSIEIGTDWFSNIQQSIKDSDFAVLLVSADFISSAFIKQHEFAAFMELEKLKPGFAFLPVLLRDVDFTRWNELASLQFFVAYGDEYGIPEMRGKLIPFAKLCRFDNNSQLIPNDNIDTYFKNFVAKVDRDWLRTRK